MKFIPNGYPMQTYHHMSAPYGYRTHPLLFTRHLHTGVDFAMPIGTPVYATADGVVNDAQFSTGGYGYLVKIDHSFGFMTYYAHLNKMVVRKGMFVKRGQLIAYSGWKVNNFDSIFEKERSVAWQSLLATINNLME